MNKKILLSVAVGVLLAGGAMAIPVLGESPLEGIELRGEFHPMLLTSQDPQSAADGASIRQPQSVVSADTGAVVVGNFLPLELDVPINGSVVESAEPVTGVPTPSTMALVLLAPAVLAALTVRRRKRR